MVRFFLGILLFLFPAIGFSEGKEDLFKEKKKTFMVESALSLPQGLLVGGAVSFSGYPRFRNYLDIGFLTIPTKKLKIKVITIESSLRYSLGGGSFIASLGLGYRRVSADADISSLIVDGDSIATGAVLVLHSFYLAPMIEYAISLSSSLQISFGLGFQIPFFVSSMMHFVNAQTGKDSSSSQVLAVDSFPYLDRVARIILPQVTLFRLTWRFE